MSVNKTSSGYNKTDYNLMKGVWRSGKHVGANKPVMRAYCRVVKLQRRYRTVPESDIFATIPGGPGDVGPRQVWKGMWKPKTEWRELPNVLQFHSEQDFDSNGVTTATIQIDNVGMGQRSGVAGIYHVIERGYFAPFRGFKPNGRPAVETENRWFDFLNDKSCQIMVVAGYGDVVFPVFDGLVNDMDISSRPDTIQLTCRDAGQVLTDQHVFSNAKARGVSDPITFADRRRADKIEEVAVGAEASSTLPGWGASNVLDDDDSSEWRSADFNHEKPHDMPWLQVSLSNGRYESFALTPAFDGMECYVAVQARDAQAPGGQGARNHLTHERYGDGNWIDEGKGNIPGTSIPYVSHISSLKANNRNHPFAAEQGYDLGDGSKIRLYFTHLDHGKAGQSSGRAYRAGVVRFKGVKRELTRDAISEEWILVDDLSDVVKTVFQWAGLNDWEVETTGVRLKSNATFNRGNYLIDIINAAAEQVGYVFYMKPRTKFSEDPDDLEEKDDEDSLGTAVFRMNQAMRKQSEALDPVELVHEDKCLTGINARFTDEPLAYNIRVRGREAKKKNGGRQLDGDSTNRIMYVYRPPWASDRRTGTYFDGRKTKYRDNEYRNGNIKKYVVHHDPKLRTLEECKIAAMFIAYREALESAQGTIQMPGFPPLQLDHQIGVFDTGTGLSTRIWVAAKQVEFQAGEQGYFTMSVGGSLIDLPDITEVRDELKQALRNSGAMPGLSKWELQNHKNSYRNA